MASILYLYPCVFSSEQCTNINIVVMAKYILTVELKGGNTYDGLTHSRVYEGPITFHNLRNALMSRFTWYCIFF